MKSRIVFAALLMSLCSLAHANPLTLTALGVSDGFTMTTFALNIPNTGPGGIGPLGVAFPSSGGVLVADFLNGTVSKFASDIDNQNFATAVLGGAFGSNNEQTIFNLGGQLYMSQTNNNRVIKLNNNGSPAPGGYSAFVPGAEGIVLNPTNGHLLVASCGNGIWDVDPTTGASHLAIPTPGGCNDGMSIRGNTVYVALQGNGVYGYDVTTAAQVFFVSAGSIPSPDGTAVGTGTLAGDLFVNSNAGQFYEIDLGTHAVSLIADLGTRGDFVTVDPNGSLLITQTDRIMRLTPPAGGGFSGGSVPEPATLTLLGLGLGLAATRRKKA